MEAICHLIRGRPSLTKVLIGPSTGGIYELLPESIYALLIAHNHRNFRVGVDPEETRGLLTLIYDRSHLDGR